LPEVLVIASHSLLARVSSRLTPPPSLNDDEIPLEHLKNSIVVHIENVRARAFEVADKEATSRTAEDWKYGVRITSKHCRALYCHSQKGMERSCEDVGV
jgi:hypothetical protein